MTLAKSSAPLSLGVDEEVLLAQPFSEVSPCPWAYRPRRPACKSQHNWALRRIIEIKRFAGVDINSPKALASPLSRAGAGPADQGDPSKPGSKLTFVKQPSTAPRS